MNSHPTLSPQSIPKSSISPWIQPFWPVAVIFLMLALLLPTSGCNTPSSQTRTVTVYTSRDQLYAEPILQSFEKETGIKVDAVYDTGATKTAGLTNRLLAEKDNPQADVFWNSEVVRTIVLKDAGVLASYISPQANDIPSQFKDGQGYWTGFGSRARVFIYNTQLLSSEDVPDSILDLVLPKWRGKVVIGNPILGTMATHHSALFVALGDERARTFFQGLKDNDVQIVVGNTAVRDAVSKGEFPLGIIDTSDAFEAIADNAPVAISFPDRNGMGTLVIPNSIALIAGGPNPENGKKFIDFMLRPEMEQTLAQSRSAQIPVRANVKVPNNVPRISEIRALDVDFETVAARLTDVCDYLNTLFLR